MDNTKLTIPASSMELHIREMEGVDIAEGGGGGGGGDCGDGGGDDVAGG